jgi:hypothetical protein
MQRTSKLAALLLTVMASGGVLAVEEVGWRDRQGNPVPETDSMKSSKGFGGNIILTPDADWEAKWARPEPPRFNTTDKVKLGGSLMALVFFTNPGRDEKGNVRILCDILLLKPDHSASQDLKNATCAEGPLKGGPYDVRLSNQLIGFTGEESDPEGTWTIKVRLRDTVRGASVDLLTRFDYHKDGS